jgi:hypothetical protein
MVVIMNNTKSYAVINSKTNIVENVIVWDGRTEPLEVTAPEIIFDEHDQEIQTGNMVVVETLLPWKPPVGFYVIDIDGTQYGIGWQYNNGEFIDARLGSSEPMPIE